MQVNDVNKYMLFEVLGRSAVSSENRTLSRSLLHEG